MCMDGMGWEVHSQPPCVFLFIFFAARHVATDTHTHTHTHTHTYTTRTTHTHTQKVTLVHGRGTGTHTHKKGARLGGQQVEQRRRGRAFTRARERRCLGPAMLWHPHLARSSSHTHPCKQRNVTKKKTRRKKRKDTGQSQVAPPPPFPHTRRDRRGLAGECVGWVRVGGRTSLRGSQPRRPPTPRPPARSRPENTHTHYTSR